MDKNLACELPSGGGERSEMRKCIDKLITRHGRDPERIGDLTDHIVDLVRVTDILTEGPVK